MVKRYKDFSKNELLSIARKICISVKTAPKGRGVDIIDSAIITDEDIKKVSDKMIEIGEKYSHKGMLRDAKNILQSDVIVLIASKIRPLGLIKCGYCGFKNCEEKSKHTDIPCSFNTVDLGIAIGSAVSIAADFRVDNRIMYTIGFAARELGYFEDDYKIVFGIPLSATSKNPFFDRA
ncbi:MAG TPA: DUF2148 domain-containing protein [Spirochaetota bacterium]|nr:DUF2148 domain-containing protein [Spirochaetota bacterium]HOM39066.1 DUF2148 domain-containing protein [Spirochaetota bacterium]HPQ49972.1 DUF2148 domain-containing protein [Spirochaetota bacterium]